MVYRNSIGFTIKKIRLNKKMTQEQLTAKLNILGLNIDRPVISKIENQVRQITDFEIKTIAMALRVKIDDLFDEVEEINTHVNNIKNTIFKGGTQMTDVFKQVKEKLSFFEGMYDIVRVVNPIDKKTINLTSDESPIMNGMCYECWGKNSFCSNCITMRAYSEQDTFVKIEYNNDKVFLITATPVNIENTTYIVEILKDISKNAKICDDKSNLELNISDLINKLNESSIRDGLTGIYNRRYINERLPVDINDSIVKEKPVSLIMADIDDLKEINDKYGHVIGDKVIISLTQLINDSIRKSSDWVSRYGGDEFLIVLNDVGLDDAYKVAEKIRNEFNSNVFKVDNNIIKVTASFGVYGTESKEFDVEKIIGNVDTNLYKAKINGKNLTYAENNLKLKEVQLSILERRIDDLRDTLNEICISTDEENANEFKLNISKYLDELIVDYIKKI